MALSHGKVARVMMDGFDMSGICDNAEFDAARAMAEVTAFSDAAYNGLPGKGKYAMKYMGFFDTGIAVGAGGWDEQMFTDITLDTPNLWGLFPAGYAQGVVSYEAQMFPSKKPIKSPIAGAVLLDVDAEGTQPAVRGTQLVAPGTVITGTGAVAGSAQNLGATTSSQVRVLTIRMPLSTGAAGSLTVTIEESNDNGSTDPYAAVAAYTTVISTTNPSTAYSTRITNTGSSGKAWRRVNITTFTGLTSAQLYVGWGVQP